MMAVFSTIGICPILTEGSSSNIPKIVVPLSKNLYPVSYTHLRAHETVLDLVCRLLLETKKNKHNTQRLDYAKIPQSHQYLSLHY